MKLFTEWIKQNYPDVRTKPVPDYVRIAYLEYCTADLEIQLRGLRDTIDDLLLKIYPVTPQSALETTNILWPSSPPVCKCAEFGGTADDFICPRCGGGRF